MWLSTYYFRTPVKVWKDGPRNQGMPKKVPICVTGKQEKDTNYVTYWWSGFGALVGGADVIGEPTEEGGNDACAPYVSVLNFNSHILIIENGMYLIVM